MQNSSYRKELKKIGVLLVLGAIVVVIFIISMYARGYMKNQHLGKDDFMVFVAILLYPLGIAYGWRRMLDIALFRQHYEKADRYYTVSERNMFHWSNMFVRIMVIGLVVSLGWLLGVYEAVKRLKYLKSTAAQ